MHRPTSDASHLYHDSHFTGLSGAALEAREHLKAREENAREQRLLRQHDQHLQQAKATCRRRSQWEQASVRRDLQAILQRTPTFHRTLQDEKEKLHAARQTSYHYGGAGGFSPPSHKGGHAGWQSAHAGGQRGILVHGGGKGRRRKSRHVMSVPSQTNTLTGPGSQKKEPSSKKRLPPLFAAESIAVGVEKGPSGDGPAYPTHCPHPASPPGMTGTDTIAGSGGKQLSKTEVRGKKYTPPSILLHAGAHKMAQSKQQDTHAGLSPSSSPDQDVPPSPSVADAVNLGQGQGQFRAATDLRRRSHHAVMAIVRVQARHERRVREADAAMARAAISRRYRFSDQPSSQSLALMSRLLSKRINAGRAAASSDDGKLGWMSLPVSGPPRRSSDTDSSHLLVPDHRKSGEVCEKPVRPRFYSLQ